MDRSRRGVVVLACLLGLVAGALPAGASPRDDGGGAASVEDGLLADLEAGRVDRFVVELAGAADVASAARVRGRDPGAAVVAALQAVHRGVVADVATEVGRAGARARGYWLTNVVVVDGGDADLARRLAARRDVVAVRAERTFPLVAPVETSVVAAALAGEPTWGVERVGADRAWADGVLGGGVVVANIDTGVDHLHEALVEQYRGNAHDGTFDHDYSWWDPTGICGDTPCDNAEHGTHTMGTIVGGDGPGPFTPDIGVAPGATWIAAKGCEDFSCSEQALLSSGQWVLAPTTVDGLAADPSRRPDIVNNSWGGGPGDPFYEEVVAAWRAAGIVPVFSSGNPGPECGQGGSPGDFPTAFSVGATDVDDVIAEFSGRGPSVYGKVNPDVSAPGVEVLSSVPGGYAEFSGTSMAAPHVAGALALVMSAEPALLGDVDGSLDAVRTTAFDILDDQCGGDEDLDPNNVYGDGRIDAGAAVALVATGGTLQGTVTDVDTTAPIEAARVEATSRDTGRSYAATTDATGAYAMFLAAGTYDLAVTAFGYAAGTGEATVVTDAVVVADVALDALPRHEVSGTVTRAEDGAPFPDATVTALATPLAPATTDGAGAWSLSLPPGTWTLRVRAGGCTEVVEATVEVVDAPVSVDLALARRLDEFGHTCRAIPLDWVTAATETPMVGNDTIGRLRLPFAFDHYGVGYDTVYVSDNGYLTFESPEYSDPFPVVPPTPGPPDAAVYALWQDLRIDEAGGVHVDVVGTAPDRALVVEWRDVLLAGGTSRVGIEVKLWEDGTIDVLYGDNPALADGRRSVIGLEDADSADAFAFSSFTSTVAPNTAYRYERTAVAEVTGVVTDANDGLPVAGTTITATPSGRTTTTDQDGAYRLTLLPGTYELAFESTGYATATVPQVLGEGDAVVVDVVLDAPTAAIAPAEIAVAHEVRSITTEVVTITNDGTTPLTWELRERRATAGATLGTGPAGEPTGATRTPGWGPSDEAGPAPTAAPAVLPVDELEVVIDDPVGDAVGVDVDDVLGGSDGEALTLGIRTATPSHAEQLAGFLLLDIDQDPTTGVPAEEWSGDPDQDVGGDVVLDLFGLQELEPVVYVFDPVTFEFLGTVPATREGTDIVFALPLDLLYGDDGAVDVAGVVGDVFQPTDWVPDAGHGTVEPFTDLPWLTPATSSGVLAPGTSVDVPVDVGSTDLQPGSHAGALVLVSDAPRSPRLTVPVSLDVPVPGDWGTLVGSVVDARTLEPIDAEVHVAATWRDDPVDVVVDAVGGSFEVHVPAGTWPLTATRAGYLDGTRSVTVVAGAVRDVEVALVARTPQAGIDVDVVEGLVERGGSTTATLTLRNDGPLPLHFDSGEVAVTTGAASAGAAPRVATPSADRAADRTTRGLGRRAPAAGVQAVGDVITSFVPDLTVPWGIGFDGDVVVGDPEEQVDARFTVAGERLGEFGTPWAGDWAADLAYDPNRDLLWQVNVGGDNGLYGLDPVTGDVVEVVTGSPWDGTSQRGLGYDPDADVFYVGGWNEGVVYRVAGPSHPVPGETLSSCAPDDPNISGLAHNRAFDALWMTTNSDSDTIWLIDALTCEVGYTIPFPVSGGFWGAGVELDAVGNLWVASQSGEVFLLESGTPLFTDVPWLAATPSTGTVTPGEQATITLAMDATGLPLGTHEALFVLTTDDPLASSVPVPVALTVATDVPGDDVVTIRTTRQAAEPGGDGRVTVTRSEDIGELTVRLRVGGTAEVGADIAPVPDAITFADGQDAVHVPVAVLDDDAPEGPETVVVSLRPSADHLLGAQDVAVVTIDDDEAPVAAGVTRLWGEDRFATAVAVSRDGFADGAAGAVVLARADAFPDGLAGGPLAAALGGPLLLTGHDALGDTTRAELGRVLPPGSTVVVLGGPVAVAPSVDDELVELGYRVERIAGGDRFATAARVADRIGDPDLLLVAVGTNFPDALAASAVATALGGVVLFSGEDVPSAVTDAVLAEHADVPRYAVGGPAVRGYPSLGAVMGEDRHATAMALADRFLPMPYAVGLARSDAFPDALTGGVHAGVRAAPVLLTPPAALDDRVADHLTAHGERWRGAYLYGGPVALAPAVEDRVGGLVP